MSRVNKKETFWVTNVSKLIVSLSDLNLSIKPMSSVNLLDERHYYLSKEQLINSATRGSLYLKRNKIVVRKFAPAIEDQKKIPNEKIKIPTRRRSAIETTQVKYEELDMSDDEYASNDANLAELDRLNRWKK